MFKKILSATLVGFLFLLTSCAEQGGPLTKQSVGTVMGAAGGAALGSTMGKGKGNVAMIALGTLAGAAVGSSVGASLDKIDQQYQTNTSQNALETYKTGQTAAWRNPDSGNSGTITPTRTYQEASGYCREYTQTISVGGKTEKAYGKACRQSDGSWHIVN